MKVLGNYLADLALDLKVTLDVELSTAELTRCVERAVADFTRFRPLQKSVEFIVDAEVSAESFTTPVASDTDYFFTAKDISASSSGDVCTLAARTPDVPRPVIVTISDSGFIITDLVIIVKGRDVDGNYIEEYFYLAGMTVVVATGYVQTGVKYFAAITEIEIDKIEDNGAGNTLIVGTGSHLGVYVQLANKPIKFNSDTISSYTRYTSYEMDYYNGRIALKTGTTMAANTAYSIKYTKSKISLDISDLKDLIRVERVEYPEGTTPQDLSTMEVWGSILTVTSRGVESQAEMTDKEHALVHYLAQHQPPGASSSGTYPSFLDQTVELAASAYALFIRALQLEHQAVHGQSTARDYIIEASAQMSNVSKYLFNNDPNDAASVLEIINDDIANLRTAATTAIASAKAILDGVSSLSSEVLLDEGDGFIDGVHDGVRVPENYREFAQAWIEVAGMKIASSGAYVQEAIGRLTQVNSIIAESAGWVAIADRVIADSQQRLAMAQVQVDEANSNMLLAERFKFEAIERRNEAWAIWSDSKQYAPNYPLGQRSQH